MAETSQVADPAFTQANDTASTPPGKQEKATTYEVGFHLIPTLSDAQVLEAVAVVRATLVQEGAVVLSEHAPERMTLSYRIERTISGKREKYTESYFGWIQFSAERVAIPALSEAYRTIYNVLRFIIVETTANEVTKPRRAVFISDRLEGTTIQKPTMVEAKKTDEVSYDEDLDKSIEAIVS